MKHVLLVISGYLLFMSIVSLINNEDGKFGQSDQLSCLDLLCYQYKLKNYKKS